ncbi:hypothetical protein [Arthrobacter phoenicis]|uniref:hypothetical protein n=1 Tax=Arthrobacter sp. 1P10PA TaxID=3132263 RepID=UPI0039A3D76E
MKDVENWDDPAAARGGVTPNVYGDGGRVEPTFLEPPALVLKARLLARTRAEATSARDAFKAAIPVRTLAPLVLVDGGVMKHRMVKQEGRPSIKQITDHHVDISVQLVAADVRLLAGDGSGPTFIARPAGLPKVTGGLRIVPPGLLLSPGGIRVAAVVASGQVVLGTSGNATPPALLRIRGPLPDFTITATLGDAIQVQRYIEPVPAGQYVDIDLDRRVVRINGNVSRRNKLVGPWIVPADGMTFKFDSSIQNDIASMELFASSAWR